MRIKRNPNGTRSLMSFSSFGFEGEDDELRKMIEHLEEHNRQALEVWNALTPEEQAQRTAAFHAEELERKERFKKECEIPHERVAQWVVEEKAKGSGGSW